MKPSRYNIFVPSRNDEYLVHNTLSDAILLVDREAKKSLETGDLKHIDAETLQTLVNCNIVVEDHVDERRIVEYHYTLYKFKSSITRFLVLATLDCNLACPYCYQQGVASNQAMDAATADRLVMCIEKIVIERRYSKVILGLYGGEPLLNLSGCARICDKLRSWAKPRNIELEVHLTTNGTLLSEQSINRLLPLSSVHVTLDGPRNIHDEKRFFKHGGGTYNKIIDGVHLLAERGINTSIRVNIAKDSLSGLPLVLNDLKEFLRSEKCHVYSALLENPCQKAGCNQPDSMYITEEEIDDTMEELWQLEREWGFDSRPKSGGPCSFVSDWTLTVDPLGNVYNCPEMAGSEEHSVGTIGHDGRINWNYSHYDQMAFDPMGISHCRDCVFLPKCYGGCLNDALKSGGQASHICRILDKKRKSVLREVKHRAEVRNIEAV